MESKSERRRGEGVGVRQRDRHSLPEIDRVEKSSRCVCSVCERAWLDKTKDTSQLDRRDVLFKTCSPHSMYRKIRTL